MAVSVTGARCRAVDFGARLPQIAVLSPIGSRHSLHDPEPPVVFHPIEGSRWYRVLLFLDERVLTWTLPRERFREREDGALAINLSSTPGFNPGENHGGYWEELRRGDTDILSVHGVAAYPFRFLIEALRSDHRPSAPAQASSRIVEAWITR